jgi:uncharacterized protein involved in exopolysaccharide biosynthesis
MEAYKSKKIVLDFFALLKAVKGDKTMMCLFVGLAAVLGLAVAFGTPKEYKSSVMLAPETSSSNSLTSNISSLASMVGMDMNFGNSNDAIYPELYPDLIGSTDFLVSLFTIPVETKDGKLRTDYYDYLKNHNRHGWWTAPGRWLASLVQKFTDDGSFGGSNDGKVNPFRLTKDQYNIAHGISDNIDCSVDKKTSVITIEVTDQDPVIAATMADSVKNRLQHFITVYRTQKARNDLAYMERLFMEAREQYVKARQQYAAFSDANQEVILQSYKSKQDDLENDMQLKFNAYTQVYEQLQLSKAKVQERTPAFTVVQSASVPIKHSNKSKLSVLLTFMFLGAMLRVGVLMWKRRSEIFRIVEAKD